MHDFSHKRKHFLIFFCSSLIFLWMYFPVISYPPFTDFGKPGCYPKKYSENPDTSLHRKLHARNDERYCSVIFPSKKYPVIARFHPDVTLDKCMASVSHIKKRIITSFGKVWFCNGFFAASASDGIPVLDFGIKDIALLFFYADRINCIYE